ncbi:hypothetical protein C1645_844626 [Glomus cerebriforme]|uniref:F-box domain-containing protein n=1 Tax=Glomus cerebriforme TaxID=658196 RepID=A0A397S4W5_9GLOM|nr:hypothetical protein C1645_844626 [Glomus cerebriforme]
MSLPSLPDECFNEILSFLDNKSLYKCLFVNKYFCNFSIPINWRDPFNLPILNNPSLINTLISCFNEDEISSLFPCEINVNNQPPLFKYGKFIRKIDHDYCVRNIVSWIKISNKIISRYQNYQDCRVRKLVDAIYHMIMREGSNLQELIIIINWDNYIDLPNFSIFTSFKPGIINLKFLDIEIYLDLINEEIIYQDTIEFLSKVSKYCNGIINIELNFSRLNNALIKAFLDIIKLQPLKKILMHTEYNVLKEEAKNIVYALKFRSETLKELIFRDFDFQIIDLSFIPNLKSLERLEFISCKGFLLRYNENLFKKEFHLKELKFLHNEFEFDDDDDDFNNRILKFDVIETIINSFCGEELIKLSLNIITPKIVNKIKVSCPNIHFLYIKIISKKFDILQVCEIRSLKVLKLYIDNEEYADILVKQLGDYLIYVEYLLLEFHVGLSSFEYFTKNCIANLKKLILRFRDLLLGNYLRKYYLKYINDYQIIHKSLKVLGIIKDYGCELDWTNEELEIIDSLKNQNVEILYICSLEDIDTFLM